MANTFSGSGTLSGAGSSSTEIVYTVGQTGPGGGVIYYDAGSTLSWGRYLEVANPGWSPLAPGDDPYLVWSGTTNQYFGGTGTTIGTGKTNFDLAIAQNSTAGKAITVVKDYRGGGKSDWFIGSTSEMMQLRIADNNLPANTYIVYSPVTGLQSANLWTSTESYQPNLMKTMGSQQYFGDFGNAYKFNTSAAPRPIRYVS